MKSSAIAIVLAASLAATTANALAWGSMGHRMVNHVGAATLPASLPAFVRTPAATNEITTLGPEMDVLKGAGQAWDHDDDNGHFLDIGDDGTIDGVIKLDDLPPNMDAYDAALRNVGSSAWKAGYVPYTILEGWEQVRMDFAYWRVDDYLATHAKTAASRAWFAQQKQLRETLTLRDIGVWGHFVADASQPLHITIHFNGWGNYPNPNGFTEAPIHSFFESRFVNEYATTADVTKLVKPYEAAAPTTFISDRAMLDQIGAYLTQSASQVVPLYQIEKAGGFKDGSPQAVAFVDKQLAHGATEFRNLITLAWQDSLYGSVSYPEIKVTDILAGKVVPAAYFEKD